MSFQTVCLYPNGDDLQFNISYYFDNHLPLVQEKFGPYGLEKVEITRFDANGLALSRFIFSRLFSSGRARRV